MPDWRVPPEDVATETETLAAIDIGTNSIHLVVARIAAGDAGPRFEVLEREGDGAAGVERR